MYSCTVTDAGRRWLRGTTLDLLSKSSSHCFPRWLRKHLQRGRRAQTEQSAKAKLSRRITISHLNRTYCLHRSAQIHRSIVSRPVNMSRERRAFQRGDEWGWSGGWGGDIPQADQPTNRDFDFTHRQIQPCAVTRDCCEIVFIH